MFAFKQELFLIMRLFSLYLLMLCLSAGTVLSKNSFAQDQSMMNTTETCAMPSENKPIADSDERWKYCDIHARQFAYREKHQELVSMLEARAKNYKASSKPARDRYEEELKRHYDSLGN
ncbi:MAG: hypothetical protein CMH27_01015 [Micavibrio sp.]|nr:hypothetical protein [Micavibrio sp.]